MALLCSPSTTQPPRGLPTLQALGHEAAARKGLGGEVGSALAGPRHPQARCVQATRAICTHLRREASFSEHRSVFRAVSCLPHVFSLHA